MSAPPDETPGDTLAADTVSDGDLPSQIVLSQLLYGEHAPSLAEIARHVLTDQGDNEVLNDREASAALVQQSYTKAQAQRVAAILVHALRQNDQLLAEEFRGTVQKAIALIDESLPQLCRLHGIDPSKPDFEKLKLYPHMIDAALSDIRGACSQFHTLDGFDGARNDFQRALGAHRNLLSPLLPDGVTKSRLKELLDTVDELRGEEGPTFVGAYERSREALTQFAESLSEAGPFAEPVFGDMVCQLRAMIDDAYRASSVTDPAHLTVRVTGKKYPLRADASDIRLAVIVENHGPGQALDAYIDNLVGVGVEPVADTIHIGALMPGRVTASITAITVAGETQAIVEGMLHWRDSDGQTQTERLELVFDSQKSDIDWDRLEQPYDLEPVSTAQELVGRSETLGELQDIALASRLGNAFLTGQKRVGKTSIALTLRTLLRERDPDLVVAYLEAGAFVAPGASDTISRLGTMMCEEISASDPRLGDCDAPDFTDTVAPLKQFVGLLRTRVPKLRVLVILDEFDELPVELYRRGPSGDALFLSLRTLAGLDHLGFLLVGGEKMAPVVDAQGDHLNKFENHPVSYFDRERHWDDFCDLVRVPVSEWLEVTDEALVRLFELTSGHPYFTKMICRELFKLMKRLRDSHATADEIAAAADNAISAAGTHNFAHFWEDGIIDSGEKIEEISIRRRKFLLAYAESAENGDRSIEAVEKQARDYGLDELAARDLLREFTRRGVLEQTEGSISARVGIFDRWLSQYGVNAITTTFTDPDAILHAHLREREEHVSAEEIADLVKRWDLYRGSKVTPEHVRAWLNQFDSTRAQRLMFGVLGAVRFYDASRIRGKLREAHGVVRRNLTHQLVHGKLKRDDIIVSYLGEVGKSGAHYARLYADENEIYSNNVVDHNRLPDRLTEDHVKALVLVDDLLGSGEQASNFLRELDGKVGGMLENRSIKCVFVALCGFGEAERKVSEAISRLRMPVELHLCDPLGESDRCFSDNSTAFPDETDRVEARGIAESHGRRLQRAQPLGYRGVQATIVFEESCPNSTLPILWDSRGDWRPLFPRHHRTL